jgi:sec-independent protein translocase protein TatA
MRPGLTEILIILGIVLLLFGAGRLADIGKGLGEGIRNFKKGLKDDEDDDPEALPEASDGDEKPKEA